MSDDPDVRSWRPIGDTPESDLHDCRTLGGPPSADEPLLISADTGA